MKISVMGIEYNHLLSGKALAEMGNEVTYISKDHKRIENIRRGYYNSEEAMVIKSIDSDKSIAFSADIKDALNNTNMCFISEGITDDSEEQMERVLNMAKIVGAHMDSHMFIIDRSKESMSRVMQIKETIKDELNKRNKELTFEVIANPNFLRA
jgi:UDPglucose 6-dehydrogenase